MASASGSARVTALGCLSVMALGSDSGWACGNVGLGWSAALCRADRESGSQVVSVSGFGSALVSALATV